jgi:hypothetical protein
MSKVRKASEARPSVGRWAEYLYRWLDEYGPTSFGSLCAQSGVPAKYLMRALAVLDRWGLVERLDRASAGPLLKARLPRSSKPLKPASQRPSRRRHPKATKRAVYEADRMCCAGSGRRIRLSEAVFDHIIPFAFGGADHPANLVTMSRTVNARKWDQFFPEICLYRGEKVTGAVGMRWRRGAFWPVINGKPRYQ